VRTIEALAVAIEAKDDATHMHLRRVQVSAVEIGREMGLSAGTESLARRRSAARRREAGHPRAHHFQG
jgi:HD-GYP domain-containing protein (c-di-GMP phosphodiesterase class II)